ncbi:CD276 antigen-like [Brachionichthys hirsutus]|uniref:CD276 antigen-like n=1 Tax=Brachionichthys hirsutus TaxID=412623 RepID=UPI0036046A61
MSVIHTWACFLICISFATQDKSPDVAVTCLVLEDCLLPCRFPPASKETIEWFKKDEAVYKIEREDDDDEDEDDDSSEEQNERKQLDGRFSVFLPLIARGNATLLLRKSRLKDRGTYRCHVSTLKGVHDAKVILKVEAPITGLSLAMSRLSGYEEMKCTVRDVFPAPRVTWATQPPTLENLRPVTRMLANKDGLYTVDSRLRRMNGKPDLIYICKVATSYGGPAWTTSLREREIMGNQGKDLTIPCYAPPYMNNPLLHWSFSNRGDPAHILTYDSQTGHAVSSPPWETHVELDGFRVPFGDGSLRLMDPKRLEHTGKYTCVFSMPHHTHTERTDVVISSPGAQRSISEASSYWWVVGLVIAVLVLALLGMLAYLTLRGKTSKHRKDGEEATELRLVRDSKADNNPQESRPLTESGSRGQSGLRTGSQLA